MAANFRRPRALSAALALAVSLIAAACSLVNPVEGPSDKQQNAARLVREGKHAEAARAYASLATQLPADSDNYQLLSAEQWAAAGNVAAAQQAFAQVSPEARTTLATQRALVAAEIAYAENDPTRAIRELDQIPVPTAPNQAQNYYWIRGRSAFLTGHPVEGTRALVERERYLADPAAVRANREELYIRVRTAAEKGAPLNAPAKTEPIVLGWLELGPVAVELERNPARATQALDAWKRQFPQHPANDSVLSMAQTQIAVATEYPNQIALLLPLSGRGEAFGVAVRDGFVAAYLEQDAARRPSLKIYDVAAESVGAAYNRAIADGAGFVVGPLTKEDVAAIAPLSAGRTPVLALNFLADSASPAKNFFQFALLPEDEARSVARRVVADGRLAGVAIVPAGELGNRVAAAFADELKTLGGTLLDSQKYDPSQPDFSDIIKQELQVKATKGEPSTHRTDATFVFVVGSPGAARLIMTQLNFYYAGDVPVYSTSDSFEPDPTANADIDGMFFPDMPWMISNDPVTTQIRDSVRSAWPARTSRGDRNRLYAFGFDAYRLVPALQSKNPSDAGEISGVTGKLHIDDHNRIRRELEWAQIKAGVPNVL
ncbi:MAG TPA: penicillin-binding protein activator [Steroidobacteraceae bacterium]|jgi:outer membrane PBP1 activator LpoA protein|nr:penicillin-binding protein activator [Steroidobacteraceae bacterium]